MEGLSMSIKNYPLYRSGQFLIVLGLVLLVADIGWNLLQSFGLMLFWLLLGTGVFIMYRATDGTLFKREKRE